MSDSETNRELEQLRAEVAALKASKQEKPVTEETPEPESNAEPEQNPSSEPEDVDGQLSELKELLETELRDLPTVTTLLVFCLGILFGRLTR